MKACKQCHRLKDIQCFYRQTKDALDGTARYSGKCKACILDSAQSVRDSKPKKPQAEVPDGQKLCRKCLKNHPFSSFSRKVLPSGKVSYSSPCKWCARNGLNAQRVKDARSNYLSRNIQDLRDNYVRRCVAIKHNMRMADVTPEMIAMKRLAITCYRLKLKLKESMNENCGNNT